MLADGSVVTIPHSFTVFLTGVDWTHLKLLKMDLPIHRLKPLMRYINFMLSEWALIFRKPLRILSSAWQTKKAWSWSLDLTQRLRKLYFTLKVRFDQICSPIILVIVSTLGWLLVRKINIARRCFNLHNFVNVKHSVFLHEKPSLSSYYSSLFVLNPWLFVLFAIRHYLLVAIRHYLLFAFRYFFLFAIRVLQTPVNFFAASPLETMPSSKRFPSIYIHVLIF